MTSFRLGITSVSKLPFGPTASRILERQAASALADLPQRLLAAGVEYALARLQLSADLLQQGGLADPRVPTEQYHGARYEPPAKHAIELGEAGRVTFFRVQFQDLPPDYTSAFQIDVICILGRD